MSPPSYRLKEKAGQLGRPWFSLRFSLVVPFCKTRAGVCFGVKLKVCDLSIEYGAFTVLKGLQFTLPKGAFAALIGPNGAGKSSLLRCIGRALQPTKGVIYLDGRDLQKLPPRETARTMAVVPQDTALDFDFTVEELVMMGRYPHQRRFRGGSEQDRKIVREAIAATGITHQLHSRQPG